MDHSEQRNADESNLVKCVLGLKFLQEGLKGFTERIIEKQHTELLNNLPAFEGSCNLCTHETLLPFHLHKKLECPYLNNKKKCFCCIKPKQRKLCPCNEFCSKVFDAIVKSHRFRDPKWKNTDPTKWKENPWSFASCFIDTNGYKGKDAASTDCSGLLSIIVNDLKFEVELPGVTIDGENDTFKKARDARNEIMHSSAKRITDTELKEYLSLFKRILELPQLANEDGVKDALQNLTKLQNNQLVITSAEKREAEQEQTQEFRRLKMCMIEEIIEFLKEREKQGRSIFVSSYDHLLRYHLLLQHACRETLTDVLVKEAAKQSKSVETLLTSNKENMRQSLKKSDFENLLLKDGSVCTDFDKMEIPLICKVIMSVTDEYGEKMSKNLTCEEVEALNYIQKETEEFQSQNQLQLVTARQKCSKVQDCILLLSDNKTGESKEDNIFQFKCKTLIIRYLYKMNDLDVLHSLLKENVDKIDIFLFKAVNDKIAKIKAIPQQNKENDRESQEKILELMRALATRKHKEKDLNTPESIEYQLCVESVSEAITYISNEIMLKCTSDTVSGEEQSSTHEQLQTTLYSKLRPIVSHGLSLLAGITGVVLYNAIRGSTILQLQCSTCEAMHKMFAMLNGPVFQDFLFEVQICLEEETKETFEVYGNATPESLQNVKDHLIEQNVIAAVGGMTTCEHHADETIESYCPKHGQFCCRLCLDFSHRGCIEQLKKIHIEPTKIGDDKMHKVRVDEDQNECWIRGSTVLENGEILLVDFGNCKLKKMSSSFEIIGHCNLPEKPSDVCYIGNGQAAVCLLNSSVQFVNIFEGLDIAGGVKLDHPCYGIAASGSLLYITDDKSVYTYNRDFTEKGNFYKDPSNDVRFRKIAVSDDGERIYITNLKGSLVILEKGGGSLANVRHPKLKRPEDVCISDKGSVLVCDSESTAVLRVSYLGKRMIETDVVLTELDGLNDPFSLSVDRKTLKLIVGEYKRDEIIVLTLNK